MDTPTVRLRTRAQMPAIGFGTWQLAEGDQAREAVTAAIKAGYRLIDTAKIYNNESSVGEAVRATRIPRNELFITTKLWTSDFGYDAALKAFDNSLEKLSLDYIDLYLLHWPNGESRKHAWRALTEIHRQGRAKAVGVSNYTVEYLKEVMDSGLMPAVNQIEFHPFIYKKQASILELCREHNIVVEAYSPLARAKGLDHKTISAIAKAHTKSAGQIMLRWSVQHGAIPIPKSAHPQRIKSNLSIFDFELTGEEMSKLDSLSTTP